MFDDEENAGGGSAGETEGVAEAPATEGDAAPTGGLSAVLDGGEPAGEADPATAPEDWRVAASGGDEKLLRELKRYASPQNVAKALVEAKARIRAGFQPPALPDGATPEQVAEYRKVLGIPETPDGYGVKFSDDVKADDSLNGMLESYLRFAHERNIPPAAVKAGVEWQQAEILRQREEIAANAARERARISGELRKEYGADYKRNLALADEFLEARPGLAKLIDPNRPDIELMRDIVALARDTASEEMLYSGDADSGGKSIDDQIAFFRKKAVDGRLTTAEDKRYMDLLAARERRNTRSQRGRAA